MSEAASEAMWLRTLETSVQGSSLLNPTVLHEDNKGALKWAQDPSSHKKTRHIDIAYHFVREQVSEFKNLAVQYVESARNFGDAFTKCLPLPTFRRLFKGIFNSEEL